MPGEIQILPSAKINREKWDACVASAENGLIYSYSFYLDQTCDQWSGLVIDDYKSIIPLPWKKKFGTRYIYQPAFIQQLGLIGNDNIDPADIFLFARYGDILWNFHNQVIAKKLNAVSRTNLVIDLSKGYDAIHSGYKKDLLLNLKKAGKEFLSISNVLNIELANRLYKKLYQQRMRGLQDKDMARFAFLSLGLANKKMCFTRQVEDTGGNVLSIGLFLKDNKRIYNIMNATTEEGRSKEANPFLLDSVIREFAGNQLLFDFEGSDIPGIKTFYEKFGATDQPYFYYHYNNLPAILRLFKK